MICPKCRKPVPPALRSCPRCAATGSRAAGRGRPAPRRGKGLLFAGIGGAFVLVLGVFFAVRISSSRAEADRLLKETEERMEAEEKKKAARSKPEKPTPPPAAQKTVPEADPAPRPPRRRLEDNPPPPPEPPIRTLVDREVTLRGPGTYDGGKLFTPIEECGWQVEVTSLEGDVGTRTIRVEKDGYLNPTEERELRLKAKPVERGGTLVDRGTVLPGETYFYTVRNIGTTPLRARLVVRLCKKGVPYPEPLPAKEPVAAARSTEPRLHTDARGGFSIAIPAGWTVVPSGDPAYPLEMVCDTSEETNFNLGVGPADPALAGGKGSWEAHQRIVIDMLRKAAGSEVKMLRQEKGTCCGYPAFLASFTCTVEGVPKTQLQYAVATPKAFYALTWTTTSALFPKLEPLFETTSKALVVTR